MATYRILNFDKVQKDFLSAGIKSSYNGKMCEWLYCKGEKDVYLSDGHFFAVVPEDLCFVTTSKNSRVRIVEPTVFEKMLRDKSTLSRAIDTGITKDVPGAKIRVRVYTLENGEEVWINENYLKYFSDMECTVYGDGIRTPLYFYIAERLVGVVLPINHN